MKNKIIYLLILILLFIFVFSNYSFVSASISDNELSLINQFMDEYSCNFYMSCLYDGRESVFFAIVPEGLKFLGDNTFIRTSQPIMWYCKYYNSSTNTFSTIWEGSTVGHSRQNFGDITSNYTIYTNNSFTDIFYSPEPIFNNPYIANTAEDLATGTFDTILIIPGSLEYGSPLGVKINKVVTVNADINNDGVSEEIETWENVYKKNLDDTFLHLSTEEFWYEIPFSQIGVNFTEGTTYVIQLVNDVNKIIYDESYVSYQEIQFTIGGLTEEDKEANRHNELINSNNKTQEAIKEQTEVSKNIFEKIGDILSYINPFSDNFFGKKLVELIITGLKSLFVPSDNFFNDWFADFNSWLGDRFGILYYPIEIVIDFLTRVGNISDNTNCILNIPALNVNFFGEQVTFFSGFTYDFNELLQDETFNNIHNIYLTVVDVILYLCLVILAYNVFSTVFGGRFIDEVVSDVSADERSYSNYERYQSNKQRYKNSH